MSKTKGQHIVLALLVCANIFLIRQLYFVPRNQVRIIGSEFGHDDKDLLSEYEYSPNFLEYIRKNHLYRPSKLKYNLSNPNDDPMELTFKDQLTALLKQTKQTGGIFIECGANDGEFLSNTLMLEKTYNWTGILIEGNPDLIPDLFSKHRKAFIVDNCLSLTNEPEMLEFLASTTGSRWDKGMGHLHPGMAGKKINPKHNRKKDHTSRGLVQCLPLLAITQAAKMDHIDFFSLDIEGHELAVLKTLPFDHRLTIDVLTVEYTHIYEGKEALQSFMESKGYATYFDDGRFNFIFVRKELNISPIVKIGIDIDRSR